MGICSWAICLDSKGLWCRFGVSEEKVVQEPSADPELLPHQPKSTSPAHPFVHPEGQRDPHSVAWL